MLPLVCSISINRTIHGRSRRRSPVTLFIRWTDSYRAHRTTFTSFCSRCTKWLTLDSMSSSTCGRHQFTTVCSLYPKPLSRSLTGRPITPSIISISISTTASISHYGTALADRISTRPLNYLRKIKCGKTRSIRNILVIVQISFFLRNFSR